MTLFDRSKPATLLSTVMVPLQFVTGAHLEQMRACDVDIVCENGIVRPTWRRVDDIPGESRSEELVALSLPRVKEQVGRRSALTSRCICGSADKARSNFEARS